MRGAGPTIKANAKIAWQNPAKKKRNQIIPSYTETHRLGELPGVIARLEAEIVKLEGLLSDPELFTREPLKFQKATDGLVERHTRLSDAEEEWLALEVKAGN